MEYFCDICNKKYKSYQSRWNHIKKFHTYEKCSEMEHGCSKSVPNVVQKNQNYQCIFCNKIYANRHSKWKHQQTCKEKNSLNTDEIICLKDKVVELEKMVNKMNNNMKNQQKINNGLINNGTINNIIVPPGQENLKTILNDKEKLAILNSGHNAHIKLTDMLYQKSNFEKFRNIYITNLSNDIGYIYDKNHQKFIVKTKKSILEDYGIERFSDIEEFYLDMGDKIDKYQLDRLKKMVHDYFNDNTIKQKKNKELLISLYNNKLHVKQIYEIINQEVNELEI